MISYDQAKRTYDLTMDNYVADLERMGVTYELSDLYDKKYSNIKLTRKKVNDFSALKISERIRKAKPGDTLVFEAGNFPLNRVQSSITAQSNRVLGSGRYTSTQNPENHTVVLSITGAPKTNQIDEMMAALNRMPV